MLEKCSYVCFSEWEAGTNPLQSILISFPTSQCHSLQAYNHQLPSTLSPQLLWLLTPLPSKPSLPAPRYSSHPFPTGQPLTPLHSVSLPSCLLHQHNAQRLGSFGSKGLKSCPSVDARELGVGGKEAFPKRTGGNSFPISKVVVVDFKGDPSLGKRSKQPSFRPPPW